MREDLILASKSPRRRELLSQMGLRFAVCAVDVEECLGPGEAPADYACRVALDKARAGVAAIAATDRADLPVLGADTDVVVDGEILGKPADRAHALAMLRRLSNRTHQVYSAVAVVQRRDGVEQVRTQLAVTDVRFGVVTPEQAEAYWATGEPADKAGAYGIQGLGAAFVEDIRGSYSGVVGLPLFQTCEVLRAFGLDVLDRARTRDASPVRSRIQP